MTKNGVRVFLVRAYTAYVSVGMTLQSPFLYGISMEKLLAISRGPKWRPSFSRTCLYSVCERGKTLQSQSLYGFSIGKLLVISRKQKWRPSFSPTCVYGVCERGDDPKIAIFVWNCYGKVVGNQSRREMVAELFLYMPIQRT